MTLKKFTGIKTNDEVKKLKSLSKHNSNIETYNALIDMLCVNWG